MSTLIKKELREHFKLALIGLALFAFLLVQDYRNCTAAYGGLALGLSASDRAGLQPLLAGSVLTSTEVFCALFAALLGWLQIHNERHRDLWAFLIHRPVSRTRIFAAKAVAGLLLYLLGAGVPLLALVLVVWLPGHVAAPFEWAMVLPAGSFLLTGMVFYFAGMLTGLRQARWYASRGLGLGAALIFALFARQAPEFSTALVVALASGALLAAAAWGSFESGGYYAGQPALGRRALTGSLTVGGVLLVGLAVALLESLLPADGSDTWSRYEVTRDGAVYKMTQPAGKPLEITALDGSPLKDPKTGRPMTPNDFNHQAAVRCYVQPEFNDLAEIQRRMDRRYLQTDHYFILWGLTPDTLWYWTGNGRLLGYGIASRRFIGSLGPDGFVPGSPAGAARFSQPEEERPNFFFNVSPRVRTLPTDHAVYAVDLEHRTVKPIFEAATNDRVGGAADVSLQGLAWDYTIVVTTNSVHLLTPDGHVRWEIPYQPGYPAYASVEVYFLEASNRFVVGFNPAYFQDRTNVPPSHLVWVAAGQGELSQRDLPSIYQAPVLPWSEQVAGLAIPPITWPVAGWFYGHRAFLLVRGELPFSLAAAAVSVMAGWWLGRRYQASAGSQAKWALFHLCTGLAGLLAFICVREWPARERCPHCQKLRLVDREQCEHCGAGFAPPPKIGIEIFESEAPLAGGEVQVVARRE